MMLIWLAAALAQDGSEPVDLVFSDTFEVFSLASVDSGWQPSDSGALAVRFQVLPTGGILTEVEAVSDLTWPETFEHALSPRPGTGFFGIDTALDLDLDVKVDVAVWDGIIDVWDTGFSITEVATFDTFGFVSGPEEVEVVVDDLGTFEPFSTSIGIIPTVSLEVAVTVQPELTSVFTGDRIETVLDTQTGEVTGEGEFAVFDLPTEPVAGVDLQSTYFAGIYNEFELVVVPSITLDTPISDFELASFDIPIGLLDLFSERVFEPVAYTHPLPALTPVTLGDVGPVLVRSTVNVDVPLENLGTMVLEGTARIEGSSAFSVYPPYFAATEGREAGVTVTFSPAEVGDVLAFLVIETNDPTAKLVRIPLSGSGYIPDLLPDTIPLVTPDPDEGGVSREDVSTCGCQSNPGLPMVWLPLGLAALFARRRLR